MCSEEWDLEFMVKECKECNIYGIDTPYGKVCSLRYVITEAQCENLYAKVVTKDGFRLVEYQLCKRISVKNAKKDN